MADENSYGVTLEDAQTELATAIEEANNFISETYEPDWEQAEHYFSGGTNLKTVKGRSSVVKTEVRDTIRALKPSIMRVLLQARKPVEYVPNRIGDALLMEQQSLYVSQLFWANGGYRVLLDAIDESLKKKSGPIKTYWEENPTPETQIYKGLTETELATLQQAPDLEIYEIEEVESPSKGIQFDVKATKFYTNGRIRMDAIPVEEFFFNRNANSLQDATVHGHARNATVSEALELGLDYDDWMELDGGDPGVNDNQGSDTARRGYQKREEDDLSSEDILHHEFLLTEAYAEYDLDGTGVPKKYVFWFGGTSYKYLHHEEVDDWCIDVVSVDPIPFSVHGHSIADLTIKEQDTETSILRAIVDNAHAANNPRHAANPSLVDFSDLMNNGIGAPIKVRNGGEINTIDIPFTGQQLLPLMQYLEADVQNKVGVTKASQGLDPDAMQSTDKEAVKNTIMLAQGQVELIVRNIIETGLMGVFKKLLKLSVRYMDRVQVMRLKGEVVPINTALIDPDAVGEPKVGLGTASPEMKLSTLNFVLSKQEGIIQQMGFDNPFCSLTQMYNTLEDITELGGLSDVGRYFKVVTPEIEKKIAAMRAEQAKAQQQEAGMNQPMDPSKALMAIEGGKSRTKQMEIAADKGVEMKKLELQAMRDKTDADLKRDKMIQDRVLKMQEIQEQGRRNRAEAKIKREQARNNALEQRENRRLSTMKTATDIVSASDKMSKGNGNKGTGPTPRSENSA